MGPEESRRGAPKVGAPKGRDFFFSLSLSLSPGWGLLVELWPHHPNCAFTLLWGHFVWTPAACRPPGFREIVCVNCLGRLHTGGTDMGQGEFCGSVMCCGSQGCLKCPHGASVSEPTSFVLGSDAAFFRFT